MSTPDIKPTKVKELMLNNLQTANVVVYQWEQWYAVQVAVGRPYDYRIWYRICIKVVSVEFIFSPSGDIYHTWQPVKDYIAKEIKPNDRERIYFDTYDPDALAHIVKTQHQVIECMKEHKHNTLFQILIIIDDFADSPDFTRNSKLLHQLYIRGRHQMISTITATQVFKAISPIVRKNITDLYIYRLRNQADLESIIEEVSAVYDKKTLYKLYRLATE